jgi:hypothetical protein
VYEACGDEQHHVWEWALPKHVYSRFQDAEINDAEGKYLATFRGPGPLRGCDKQQLLSMWLCPGPWEVLISLERLHKDKLWRPQMRMKCCRFNGDASDQSKGAGHKETAKIPDSNKL